MERRDYLELMTGQIRCKKMCPVIVKEVEDHIEDQKQAFMAEGMKEEEAEKAPLSEEEELEQFIDSIQPKKKNNPSDIIPREKTLTDDEKKLFT